MASNPIPVEPRYPLGDAAGLLEYRRTATGMKPLTPAPVGHVYIAITCTLRGFGGGAAGFGGGGAGVTLVGGGPGGGLGVRISPQRDPRIPFEDYHAPKRDPWAGFEDYHPPTADLITSALMAFGIFLGLAAFIALLLTITNGWTS